MARISEAEFAKLKAGAARNVVFNETGARPPTSPRVRRLAGVRSSRARARRSTFWRDYGPALTFAGVGAALGLFAASSFAPKLNGLGNAQDASAGGEIGSLVGQAVSMVVPVPGIGMALGEIGSLIGGLFGPGVHRTPGGETYDQATYEFHQTYFAMMALANQVRATGNLPPAPTIGFVGLGTPGCDATPDNGSSCAQCNEMNCGQVNAPLTGPYIAKLLADPQFASYTAESQETQLQALGAYDAAIKVQTELTQQLQFILESLQSGTMVWQAGKIVPYGTPPASDYQGQTGTAPPAPASSSYQATQTTSTAASSAAPGGTMTASLMAWVQANPVLAIGGAALFLILVTSDDSPSPSQGSVQHA